MKQYDVRFAVEKKNRFDIFGLFTPAPITEAEALKAAKEISNQRNMIYISHKIEGQDLIIRMEEKGI